MVKRLVGWIGGPAAALAVVWAALVHLEALPVLQRDFSALAAEVQENKAAILRRELRELRSERAKLELLRVDFMNKGVAVPSWITERLVDIQVEEEELQEDLRNAGS